MREVKVKPGFKYFRIHMIFDIKMDGKCTQKATIVAGDHKTESPSSTTYSGFVTR